MTSLALSRLVRPRWSAFLTSAAVAAGCMVALAPVTAAATPVLTLGAIDGLAGSSVAVTGNGFAPNTSISLFWSGIPMGASTTDSTGMLATTITVPELPGAGYIVYATGPAGEFLASAGYTIDGPGFTLSPTRGVAGSTVDLLTGGVRPNSVLRVDLAGIPLGTFSSDSTGVVRATFTVPAVPAADYALEAITASGSFFASAIFTVLPADSTPPTVTCTVTPAQLWPADHRLVDVNVSVIVADSGSGPAGFTLDSVTSSEADNGLGDGDQAGDVQGFTLGTPDVTGQLRAERSGAGPGRTYWLKYTGSDQAGNKASCVVAINVPHDLS